MSVNGNKVHLLQWADSAFPTGGYAYSHGLESAARLGLFQSVEQLREYISCFLEQTNSGELPFVCSSYRAREAENEQQLEQILNDLDAWLAIPEIHKASQVQGKNWLTMLEGLYPEAQVANLREWLEARRLPTHYAVIFGACMRLLDVSWTEARQLYLYLAARDQVAAAVRLGLVGPTQGQIILRGVMAELNEKEITEEIKNHHSASRSALMLEIAQARHRGLYTKLFRN